MFCGHLAPQTIAEMPVDSAQLYDPSVDEQIVLAVERDRAESDSLRVDHWCGLAVGYFNLQAIQIWMLGVPLYGCLHVDLRRELGSCQRERTRCRLDLAPGRIEQAEPDPRRRIGRGHIARDAQFRVAPGGIEVR